MTSKTMAHPRESATIPTDRSASRRRRDANESVGTDQGILNGDGQDSEETMNLWWRMETDGKITFANRGLQDTLGFTSDEFLPKTFFELIHPEDQASTIEVLHRLTDEDTFINHVSRFRCQDHTYRRIHWQATNAAPEGFITAIGKSIDFPQQDDQRESLKTSKIISNYKILLPQEKSQNLIHDLNNILSAMLGYTQLASLKLSNEHAVQELLQKAIAVGHRAHELVEKSLKSQGQDTQAYQAIELREVVEEAIVLLHATLPDTVKIQKGEIYGTRMVYGDFTKIFQLVVNLCSNAVNVMNSTGGILSIWIDQDCPMEQRETSAQDNSYVHLSIGDTGPGMSSDTLQRIFEPYFTTRPANKGTGLGLTIVNEIITDLGGFIKVESELGKGSTFHVYFPSHTSQLHTH